MLVVFPEDGGHVLLLAAEVLGLARIVDVARGSMGVASVGMRAVLQVLPV